MTMDEEKLVVPLATPFGEILIRWYNGKLEQITLSNLVGWVERSEPNLQLNEATGLRLTQPTGIRLAPFPVSDRRLAALIDVLAAYFSGEAIEISVPLKLSGHTDFQRDVWRVATEIPYGEVRTYGWVAARLGRPKTARAVGGALAQNPFPVVVPCHRVVRTDGSLGGFSAGLEWKKALLQLEGTCLRWNKK
jgi:methylated-DNA-[protein]-cysteine S-methyltransferase